MTSQVEVAPITRPVSERDAMQLLNTAILNLAPTDASCNKMDYEEVHLTFDELQDLKLRLGIPLDTPITIAPGGPAPRTG